MTGDKMTVSEVAAIFGVTAATVRRYDDAGLLPAQRTPGHHRRFDREAVEALAEKLRDAHR